MIIYRFKIVCTVRHALRMVNIKALLLHALRRTVVIKYMSLVVKRIYVCLYVVFKRICVCLYVVFKRIYVCLYVVFKRIYVCIYVVFKRIYMCVYMYCDILFVVVVTNVLL